MFFFDDEKQALSGLICVCFCQQVLKRVDRSLYGM